MRAQTHKGALIRTYARTLFLSPRWGVTSLSVMPFEEWRGLSFLWSCHTLGDGGVSLSCFFLSFFLLAPGAGRPSFHSFLSHGMEGWLSRLSFFFAGVGGSLPFLLFTSRVLSGLLFFLCFFLSS